jgi:hypothetical protein
MNINANIISKIMETESSNVSERSFTTTSLGLSQGIRGGSKYANLQM